MTNLSQNSAHTLSHALPQLLKLKGKCIVIKYGGNAMTDNALQDSFAKDIALLKTLGLHPVVVHGGGPQVDELLDKLGHSSARIDGMRVTDTTTRQAVEMVLGGQVNQDIVARINRHYPYAIGLNGKDAHLIGAKKLTPTDKDGNAIDLGWVGDIVSINHQLLHLLIEQGYIPVIAPIGMDTNAQTYNINADLVAGSVAVALGAEQLLLLTNIKGVLDKAGDIIPTLSPSRIDALSQDGTISGGMIPKLTGALDAIAAGVTSVRIIDGRIAHACVTALLGDGVFGTQIHPD